MAPPGSPCCPPDCCPPGCCQKGRCNSDSCSPNCPCCRPPSMGGPWAHMREMFRKHHQPQCMIGKPAPQFKGMAVMPDGEMKEISLEDYKGKYVVLFFYPLDFTFVCPSEILAFDRAVGEFEQRGVQLISCSIDSHFVHNAWRETPVNKGGIGKVKFPMLSDMNHFIAKSYGCHIEEPAVSIRGLYLIDKEGVVQHITLNNLPLGRNVEEVLRTIDALQYTEQHGEVCPANWKKGEAAMKPSAEGVASYLGQKYQ
eukprot:Protomagalhaensia_wolfi_Nauph_80__5835@NODE_737_length_2050_cov_633_088513_g551_i0_p1_GENE_NODE_737_length_2050_cov_633_088513_g551_i0NODE_737_length_2050_cov_633_088513_g551_i0_p1_ORF_typecomplete_len297_score41_29AhpCTSA/PF00578_21/1_5e29Redoxin/PF08534_10/4_8e201cysPrx_C/PF10417_9/4_7e13SCO1SenC/PF02630_14/0_00084_NODE_737_length_2050_cov_633_088513_g551_i011601924